MTTLNLKFDNLFVESLPADSDTTNERRQVYEACYSFVKPQNVGNPTLVAYAKEVAEQIGLSPADCETNLFTEVFVGNTLLAGMQPHAQCYGGHQFGHWAGQLGDGRAIILGEIIGKNNQRYALQLKGAGETPYSRSADGLAVLRSSIREFLCSEAMHHLGIPTTRALSVIETGESVMRDMFYDGRPKAEPGAVVCRVAPSFLRLGSYELFTSRGDLNNLKQLVDYTITTLFPHLGKPNKESYIAWFREVAERTVDMVVHWMRVGFVHGVFNTDNTSILGLTIDYGPYGWIDNFDPNWTPNTTDAQGKRYRFGSQAQIAQWNLLQLANAIYPLIEEAEPLREILNAYVDNYTSKSQAMRNQKLGFKEWRDDDESLQTDLNDLLFRLEMDMTIFYRRLVYITPEVQADELLTTIETAFYAPEALTKQDKETLTHWLQRYQNRTQTEGMDAQTRVTLMNAVNPKYVLRNYLTQEAIELAEKGDYSRVNELLAVMRRPYDEQVEFEHYAVKRPDWARQKPGCSMLSCSS